MTRPLVLVHGAGGCGRSWAPVVAALGELGVVWVDLPGRGATPGPAAATAAAAAEWLAERLTGRPVVVGHSYGGAVALSLALGWPERVAGVALVSSGARLKVAPAILTAAAAAGEGAPLRLDFAFGPATPPAVVAVYAEDTRDVPPATTLADWRACDGFDVRDRLSEVATPALVLHGALDRLTPPAYQAWLADALPAATRVERAGVGHMLPWEDPAGFAEALRGWLPSLG